MKTKTSTTRQFTSVNDWIKSNPSEEETKKVLELINKTGKRELKQLLWEKRKELNKLTKFADQLKEWGFKISDDTAAKDIAERIKTVINEIQELQTEIGPVIKRIKKVEEIEEEFNVEENAKGVKQGPNDKSVKGPKETKE